MKILLIGLLAFLCCARSQAADPLQAEAEQTLRKNILDVWFPRIVDQENGGFLCDFDADWKPAGQQPKTIVYQARAVWTASKAAAKYPQDARYLEAAKHGFRFLNDVMWDKEQGGWYWRLDRAGKTPGFAGAKHAYGISFGIYAASAYFATTKDPQGLELAKKGFDWLESHGHDAKNGGYYEFFTRDGSRILDDAHAPQGGRNGRDFIGTRIGYKSMNTHIHLLEAMTALYQVWPDPRVKERTTELFHLVRDRIVAPPGAMHQVFNSDWTPVPDLDSFGHDVETGYLLIEAAEALGMKDDPRTMAVAKSLVDHALEYSLDTSKGGFRETGGVFGPIVNREKGWWTQAEGLNALLLLSKKFPNDPRHYRALFEKQWAYVKANLIDDQRGDWYPAGLDAGGNRDAHKASEWKCCYHNGRAMFNLVEWMER